MNTYKSVIKMTITQKVTTTTPVLVQAVDAYKAKLQLEAMYGKGNVVTYPQKVGQIKSRFNTTLMEWTPTF